MEKQNEELRVVHALVIAEQIKAIREIYDERFLALYKQLDLKDEQLKLQAKEYERRLEGLNGEAKRILEAQQRSVSADKFEGVTSQFHTSLTLLAEQMKRQIDAAESKAFLAEKNLDDKISVLSKQVYIIVGMLIIIELVFKFLIK
jgi:hypothetical protein